MLCARVLLAAPRFDMESTDEPQRKIFRARKTMKVSDRQQLEAVYKVKEDSLNMMEVTLLNGTHGNGDSNAFLNGTDRAEDKPELDSALGICPGPDAESVGAMEVPNATLPHGMEKRRASQDLTSELELLPTEQSISEQEGTSNTASKEVGDHELDQNKDFHSNAGNGANSEVLDQTGNRGSSLCGSERSSEKDFVEEQVEERGSVKTVFLSEQCVEETVLKDQPEEALVAEKELEEAQPEEDLMKDQESVEEPPLHDGEEAAHHPQLVETVVEPQQKELLEKPEEELAGELQQNVVVPAEPQGDLAPTEEMEVAEVEETPMADTQPGGKVEEVLKQQLVGGLEPEMGRVERPQLKVRPAQEPQMEAGLAEDPRPEEDLTEDQLMEKLAEEQQFGEELAEDHLLDELVEGQRPEDVLEKCKESNSLVKDDQEAGEEGRVEVAEEGGNKEKLEIQEKTEDQSVVIEETPEVMVEEQDLEVVVERQEMKDQVTFELVVETPKAKEALKQIYEEHRKLTEDKAEEMQWNWDMEEKMEQESTVLQETHVVGGAGDEAISSIMEIDQDSKADNTTDLPKPLVDLLGNGRGLENSDSMETEDIIPILEKLAPVGDRLNSFSQPPVLSEVDPGPELGEKVELSQGSPKQEHKNNLPSEAFLVLSDEEDSCIEEVPEKEVQLKPSSPTEKVPPEVAEKEPDTRQDEPNKEPPPDRSEAIQRKRSKSDDLDGMHSKRRRYKGEEAELQLKITTRASMDQKLQKVIQRLLQEKLCALQCAEFDKALADLKTRVEQIECTKHEGVLSGIQAKIARLLKRFGAAKEDMKKRQETRAVQAVKPVQPGSPSKAAGDGASSRLAHRNVGSGQQMPEVKRSVGDAPATPVQVPTSAGPPPLPAQQPPHPASSNQPLQRMAQMPSLQSPVTDATPARPMPDWKLIHQINATPLASPKPLTPVTATQAITPVLSSPATTALMGTSQVSGGNGQPMSVSLQSLQSMPMILHLPVMQSTMQNGTVMQRTTGTLVANQQSGQMEFIPSQNQGIVRNLQKATVSLASAITPKLNNSPSLPSPVQRNSPATAVSSGPVLSVYGVSTSHSVAQPARTSLATVSTSGQYTTTNSRTPIQMKGQSSLLTSPTSAGPPAAPRAAIQTNQTPTTESTVVKRAAETSTQSGKAGDGGFIDLTLDEETGSASQDARKPNPINISGVSQPSQLQLRPPQPPLTAPMQQNTMAAGLPSQATIQVLPTAQTTVNVNQRPVMQAMPRLSTPRTPTGNQVVYSPLPSAPIQTPARTSTTQGQTQGFRQVSPQTGGMTIRMPQPTGYVVNNAMTIGPGRPQLTVHHRPPPVRIEPARPIHPAPLPEAPQLHHLPPEAASTSPPQKPHLKLARVQSQNGIVLSWSVLEVDRSCASVDSYHLYAYHEDPTAATPSQWKKVGEVKALPLPMACTLTQFVSGSKYYFAVRAKDVYGRFGVFCDPQSTDVIATQNS